MNIQVVSVTGILQSKLSTIVRNLVRDCHFQAFAFVSKNVLHPCNRLFKPVVGIISNLPFNPTRFQRLKY